MASGDHLWHRDLHAAVAAARSGSGEEEEAVRRAALPVAPERGVVHGRRRRGLASGPAEQQRHAEAALAAGLEARLPRGGPEGADLDGVAVVHGVARREQRPLPREAVGAAGRGAVALERHGVGAAQAVERRDGEAAAVPREYQVALPRRQHAQQRRRPDQPLGEDEAGLLAAAVRRGQPLRQHQRRPRDAEAAQLGAQPVVFLHAGRSRNSRPLAPEPSLSPGMVRHLLDRPRRRVRVVPQQPLLGREHLRRDAGERALTVTGHAPLHVRQVLDEMSPHRTAHGGGRDRRRAMPEREPDGAGRWRAWRRQWQPEARDGEVGAEGRRRRRRWWAARVAWRRRWEWWGRRCRGPEEEGRLEMERPHSHSVSSSRLLVR